jgi:hypothetical protein
VQYQDGRPSAALVTQAMLTADGRIIG